MTTDTVSVQKGFDRIFGSSELPAAVYGKSGIICSNDAFDRQFGDNVSCSEVCAAKNGKVYNALTVSEDEQYKTVLFTESDSTGSVLTVLTAAARKAATDIVFAADEMHDRLDDSGRQALDRITSASLTLLSEFIIPGHITRIAEQVFTGEKIYCISAAAQQFADSVSESLAKRPASVSTDIETGLYSKTDIAAVLSVMLEYTVTSIPRDCTISELAVSVHKDGDRIALTVKCSTMGCTPRIYDNTAVSRPVGYDPGKQLVKLLESRYSCTFGFSESNVPVISVTVSMPAAEGIHSPSVSGSLIGSVNRGRFSEESLMLSRLRTVENIPERIDSNEN